MMQVLGFDTATTGCSAAVWRDGDIVAVRRLAVTGAGKRRGQAETLLPLIEATLADAGVAGIRALDRIAVTIGPGAFTGLRIALATARGFGVATGIPLVGISTFDAVAHAVPPALLTGRHLIAAVESRRAEPYLQAYSPDLTPLGAAVTLPPSAIAAWLPDGPLLVAGDAAATVIAAAAGRTDIATAPGDGVPDAAIVAALGAALGAARPAGEPLRPMYLRPADVTVAKAPA